MSVADFEALVRSHHDLPDPNERRALRKRSGLAQADIARALHVLPCAVSRYESGMRTPRGDALVAYVGILQRLRALTNDDERPASRPCAPTEEGTPSARQQPA